METIKTTILWNGSVCFLFLFLFSLEIDQKENNIRTYLDRPNGIQMLIWIYQIYFNFTLQYDEMIQVKFTCSYVSIKFNSVFCWKMNIDVLI